MRRMFVLICEVLIAALSVCQEKISSTATFDYDIVRQHEIQPHRRTFPHVGVRGGFNQLHLTLTVSTTGDVTDAEAEGEADTLQFWPELKTEVMGWRFTPFEKNGTPVSAQIEEYIDLVPPERLPSKHLAPPALTPRSKIEIQLQRSGCFGSCPSYTVTLTNQRVSFEGGAYVVARGKHAAPADTDEVRDLARKFIAADFYSMDERYVASVTDNPFYSLSISIDGHTKKVEDYVGAWVGMPAAIEELENEVDEVAQSKRWIEGDPGLVSAMKAERFNFTSFEAQVMVKEAAARGEADTVHGLLEAGVPLDPIEAPKPKEPYMAVPFEHVGWLSVASHDLASLKVLIQSGASKEDQKDKDLGLAGAASSGNLDAVQALVAYGANPNADLSKLTLTENGAGMTLEGNGAGSILIYAAQSGNPDIVHEILSYHPKLEARDRNGRTAIFAAAEYQSRDKEGARAECVRMLVQAGADVNARDKDGNTPLHETFLTDVEEELLRLGADVNARNNKGETPIFTNVDDEAIPLFIRHGADLTIRDNDGKTVMDAAKDNGPKRQEALRKAIDEARQE